MGRRVGVLARLVVLGFGLVVLFAARAGAATGPDVSNYQHPNGIAINWGQVRAAGHTFAYIKATEGPSGAGGYYTNGYFRSDWDQAGAAGLYRGAYHFARPQRPLDSAVAQARYFVAATGTMNGARDLPPVLDLEDTGGLSRSEMAAWTQAWLTETERLTGRRPIIYAGYYFWNDNVASTAFGSYRLWIPRYTTASNPLPLPSSWSTWTLWQSTSTARVPGISGNVDLNQFCCPDSTLAALAGPGASAAAGNPFGTFDEATRVPGAVHLSGWAIDPDTTSPVTVHVYVDNVLKPALSAGVSRGDIATAFPGWGAKHGFDATIAVGPGDHSVCVYAINQSTGNANPRLGCRTVVGNPVGAVDEAAPSGPGRLMVRGWAVDPDTSAPVAIHVYVDGARVGVATADRARVDIAAAFPGVGAAHGYQIEANGLRAGPHAVCVYAINQQSGNANPLLGCRTVAVLSPDPIGALDVAVGGPGGVTVSGWALDPDTTDPIDARIVVDGTPTHLPANAFRADVAAAYPASGPEHAFAGYVDGIASGPHTACGWGVNVASGVDTLLGCRSFVVPTGDPFGAVDSVVERLSILTVSGWAVDPDSAAGIGVRVVVDGVDRGAAVADGARADIAAALPGYGAGHGFTATAGGIGGGTHRVCVTGIGTGPGASATVGCRSITTTGSPFGALDSITRDPSTVMLSGWAIDPDTPDPIQVHVYVDGVGAAILLAGGARPDVAGDLPWYGPAHGFAATLEGLDPGPHTVCTYAINTAAGTNTTIACRTV